MAKLERLQTGGQHAALNLELLPISTETVLSNLADTAKRIAASFSHCAEVTISFSNLAYEPVFDNWFLMVGEHGCSAIIALDDETCAHLVSKPSLRGWCMVKPPSLTAKFETNPKLYDLDFQGNFLLGMAKLLFPALFVFCGKGVIFSDMDLFWQGNNVRADLLGERNAAFDIQIASHVLYNYQHHRFSPARGEVNIGFYFFRHTPRTTVFFRELLLYTVHHAIELGFYWTWDQKLYDRFIRNPLPAGDDGYQWDNRFKDFKEWAAVATWHNGSAGIPFRRLPSSIYTTNIGRRGSKLQFHNETATVHISFGIKEPALRMYCAHRLGLVSAKSSYRPPSSLLPSQRFCFEVFDATGNFTRRVD